jgi:hypothetical protein
MLFHTVFRCVVQLWTVATRSHPHFLVNIPFTLRTYSADHVSMQHIVFGCFQSKIGVSRSVITIVDAYSLIGYTRSPGLTWLHAFYASIVIYLHIDIDYASTKISNTGGSEVRVIRPNSTISVAGLTLDCAFWFHGWTIRMPVIHLKSHFFSIDRGRMALQARTKAYCRICSFLGFKF